MKNLTEKIVQTIERQHIHPIPVWQIVAREWLLKIIFIFSSLVGALAVAASIFMLTDYDWDILSYLHEGIAGHVLEILPVVWLAMLGIVLLVTYYNVRKLRNGYSYSFWYIILSNVVVSIILGSIFFWGGFGKFLHTYFYEHVSLYHDMTNAKSAWVYPEKGLLSGVIVTSSATTCTVEDIDGVLWTVHISPTATWEDGANLYVGNRIKLFGTMSGPEMFEASVLRPG